MNELSERVGQRLQAWDEQPVIIEYRAGGSVQATGARALMEHIAAVETLFRNWGVHTGHIIFLFLYNSTDFVVALLALLRLGAVPVPVKMEYRRLELTELFANARPQALICERNHLELIRDHLQGRILIEHGAEGFTLAAAQESCLELSDLDPRISMILYTYRGYGYPLGAMIGEQQILHGTDILQEGDFKTSRDRILVILPLTHIFSIISCLLFPILYKMTAVFINSLNPRSLFELLHKHQITHFSAVPEIYLLLSRFQDSAAELPWLRTLICGGSRLSAEDFHKIRLSAGAELLHGYGLTELAPVSRNMRGHTRAGTVGPVCRGIECRIAAPDPSGRGEIEIRSPYAFKGYLRRPRETSEAFAQGWFQTGDIGRIAAGHLEFVRESKRTCKVNGTMVDLEEVRRALLLNPIIREAHVYHEPTGLCARVSLSRGKLDREAIVSIKMHLRSLLAEYKIPKTILEEHEG